MIVRSRAWLLLLLALAPWRLEAADATNAPATTPATVDAVYAVAGTVSSTTPDAAVSGTYTPDPADLCDWSEGHIVSTTGAPLPPEAAHAQLMKNILLEMAKRLVEVQQKTPDPHIQAIIDQSHLGDSKALAALSPDAVRQDLIRTAMSLVEAAKTDTLAAHLMDEFKISFKSGTPSPPATPPSTNAPASVAT
jgi:hypothetical protein